MSYKLEKYNSPFFFGTHGSNTNPRTATQYSAATRAYNSTLYDGISTLNNSSYSNIFSVEDRGYAFASGMLRQYGSNVHVTYTYRIENNESNQAGLKVNYCGRSYGSYGSEIACAKVSKTFSVALENGIGDNGDSINGYQRLLGFY